MWCVAIHMKIYKLNKLEINQIKQPGLVYTNKRENKEKGKKKATEARNACRARNVTSLTQLLFFSSSCPLS